MCVYQQYLCIWWNEHLEVGISLWIYSVCFILLIYDYTWFTYAMHISLQYQYVYYIRKYIVNVEVNSLEQWIGWFFLSHFHFFISWLNLDCEIHTYFRHMTNVFQTHMCRAHCECIDMKKNGVFSYHATVKLPCIVVLKLTQNEEKYFPHLFRRHRRCCFVAHHENVKPFFYSTFLSFIYFWVLSKNHCYLQWYMHLCVKL